MSQQERRGSGSVTRSHGNTNRLRSLSEPRSRSHGAPHSRSTSLALLQQDIVKTLPRIAAGLANITYFSDPSDGLAWIILLPDRNQIVVRVMVEPRPYIEVVGLWSSPIDFEFYPIDEVLRVPPDGAAGYPLVRTLGMAVWSLANVLQTKTRRALSRTETPPGKCPFV